MADAPLSFIQLMRGVGKTHKELAASIPGARRIPEEMASKVEKMLPTEVLEEYNKRKMFGQTPTGEPYRGVIRHAQTSQPGPPGRLPEKGHFLVVPESKAERVSQGLELVPGQSDMRFRRATPYRDEPPLTGSYLADVDQIKLAGQPRAELFDINALDVGRGMGPMQYRAMYDMINAGGDVNQAGFLTDINVLRRLGNVAPIALSRQGLRGIMPISESPKPRGSYSQQLFSQPVGPLQGGVEKGSLDALFGGYDDLMHEAMSLEPKSLRGLDDEALAGILYSREAQLAKAYGPEAKGGLMALDRHLGDADILFRLTEPYRSAAHRTGETSLGAGIGPHTYGRGRTTEEAIHRILQGESPDEIVENLRRQMGTNVGGFKGRYAKGGLASALQG